MVWTFFDFLMGIILGFFCGVGLCGHMDKKGAE